VKKPESLQILVFFTVKEGIKSFLKNIDKKMFLKIRREENES